MSSKSKYGRKWGEKGGWTSKKERRQTRNKHNSNTQQLKREIQKTLIWVNESFSQKRTHNKMVEDKWNVHEASNNGTWEWENMTA